MSGGGSGESKTEKPTPERLRKARKEGQIPRTQELGTWAAMAVASGLLPWFVDRSIESVSELMIESRDAMAHPEVAKVLELMLKALEVAAVAFLPLGVGLVFVGVLASIAQGGVTLGSKAAKPSFKKLNPVHGVKRMFGPQGMWESAKALIKTAALVVALWLCTGEARALLAASGGLSLAAIVDTVASACVAMIRVAAVTGLVLAVADYAVVRQRMMKKLKMSKTEIKQEMKQSEGDPMLKGRIRSQQMAMSRNRMMSAIKDADALLINPVHVAVAIKYEPSKGAPRVVAKGAGPVAARIREKAAEHQIPMIEDIPLARALHASCDLGQEVPPQLFTAVARVLAFVMHLKSKGAAYGVHRPGFTAPDLTDLPKAGRRRATV